MAAAQDLTLEPLISKLEKFILYETHSYLYVVGCDKRQTEYRVIKLDRQVEQPSRLDEILFEDDCVYTRSELKDMLEMIHEGNKAHGGLQRINTGFGILGFVRFLDCYYLILITQRKKVGVISGNTIYGVKATEMVSIRPIKDGGVNQSWGKQVMGAVNKRLNPTQHEIAEQRYLGLFQFIDLTKDFYFSYTYDLTHSLQRNIATCSARVFPPPPCKDMYAWNHYLTSEIESCVGNNTCFWVLPMIHGSFIQRRCSLFGRIIDITLIARRSRHFAGTRYLKRGVSDCGMVANDVEMEQTIHAHDVGEGLFSSFLQVRGSIPTFWTQETSVTMPKPPIVLNRIDPTYAATQLHFADLMKRYASPVLVLDLTKHKEKREREMIVSGEFRTAIECLNSYMDEGQPKIQYCALDFSELSKQRNMNVLSSLKEVASWATAQTGFFCSSPVNSVDAVTGEVTPLVDEPISPSSKDNEDQVDDKEKSRSSSHQKKNHRRIGGGFAAQHQQGVLRTNCIDCLDRTNVAQFCVGVHALGLQLTTLGVVPSPVLENDSAVVVLLMDIYSAVGDQIALQYGGSEAHKKVREGAGVATTGGRAMPGTTSGGGKEFLTSIRRYYSNAFTDRLKQDAMNVFLGHYVVSEHEVALWDLDNDYYLHNFKVQTGVELTMTKYRQSWETEADEIEKKEEQADEDYEEEEEEELGKQANLLDGDNDDDEVSKGRSMKKAMKHQGQLEAVKLRVTEVANSEAEAQAVLEKSRSHVAAAAAQSPLVKQILNSPVPVLKPEGTRSRRGDLRHSYIPNINDIIKQGEGESQDDDYFNNDDEDDDEDDHGVNERYEEEYDFDDEDDEDHGKKAPSSLQTMSEPQQKKAAEEKLLWKEGARRRAQQKMKDKQQERVRRRILLQRESSQQWWKDALKEHAKTELKSVAKLPSKTIERFERIYRPEKLTQFDKKFAYEYNLPIPLQAIQEVTTRRGGFGGLSAISGPKKSTITNTSTFTTTALHQRDMSLGSDQSSGLSSMDSISSRYNKASGSVSGQDNTDVMDLEDRVRMLGPNALSMATPPSYISSSGGSFTESMDTEAGAATRSQNLEQTPGIDDEEGPDRVVTIGRLVRELFPISRGQKNGPTNGSFDGPSGPNGSFNGSKGNDKLTQEGGEEAEQFLRKSGELTMLADPAGRYGVSMTSAFIGDDSLNSLNENQKHDKDRFSEFSEFANAPLKYFSGSLHQDAKEEMEIANWEVALASTDVAGCRAITELAHTSKTIRIGPYRGFDRNESAKEVTSILSQELFSLTLAGGSHDQTIVLKEKAEEESDLYELSKLLAKRMSLIPSETTRVQFLMAKYNKSALQISQKISSTESSSSVSEGESNQSTPATFDGVYSTAPPTVRFQEETTDIPKTTPKATPKTTPKTPNTDPTPTPTPTPTPLPTTLPPPPPPSTTTDDVDLPLPPEPNSQTEESTSLPNRQRRGSGGPVALAAAAAAALVGTSTTAKDDNPSNDQPEATIATNSIANEQASPTPYAPMTPKAPKKFVDVDPVKDSIQNLKKLGYDGAEGLLEQISYGLESAHQAVHLYASAIDENRLSSIRSPYSDNETIDLYASSFQDDALSNDQTLDLLVRVNIPPVSHPMSNTFPSQFPTKIQNSSNATPLLAPELETVFRTSSMVDEDAIMSTTKSSFVSSLHQSSSFSQDSSPSNMVNHMNDVKRSSSISSYDHEIPLDMSTSMADHVAYSNAVRRLESQEAHMRASEMANTLRASMIASEELIEPESGNLVPYIPLNPPLPPPKHVIAAQEEAKARKEALLKLLQDSSDSNATPLAHAELLHLQRPVESTSTSSNHRPLSAPSSSSLLSKASRRATFRRASSFIPSPSSSSSSSSSLNFPQHSKPQKRGSFLIPKSSSSNLPPPPPPSSSSNDENKTDYKLQQQMINTLGGHFQDPISEQKFAEDNIGPVFGMTSTSSSNHNLVDSNQSISSLAMISETSQSTTPATTTTTAAAGRGGTGGGRRRKGSLAPLPTEVMESIIPVASYKKTVQQRSARTYYGYTNPNSSKDQQLQHQLQQQMLSGNDTRPFHDGDEQEHSISNKPNQVLTSSSSSSCIQAKGTKQALNQSQSGFFTKVDNPYVLFNKAGTE